MSLETIRREFELHHAQLRKEGIPDEVCLPVLMRYEAEIVKLQLEQDRARLDVMRSVGTAAYAERNGVDQRTVRNMIKRAVDEIGNKMHYRCVIPARR